MRGFQRGAAECLWPLVAPPRTPASRQRPSPSPSSPHTRASAAAFYQSSHSSHPTHPRCARPRSCATAQFIAHCIAVSYPDGSKTELAAAGAGASAQCLSPFETCLKLDELHPNNLREEGSSSLHCTGWFEHVEGQISVVSSSEPGFATWTGPAAAVCLCGSQYSSTSRGLMQLL